VIGREASLAYRPEPHVPGRLEPEEALARSRGFLETMRMRRSVRHFSDEPVPAELVENALRVAGSAPSGANQQPWSFYVRESVGIAVGFLLASLHVAGLSTLTHAPSPMRFLTEILDRPANERPFLLVPVG
jgi:Nitroreductase family